jgi:WD domain, G-beta repeat
MTAPRCGPQMPPQPRLTSRPWYAAAPATTLSNGNGPLPMTLRSHELPPAPEPVTSPTDWPYHAIRRENIAPVIRPLYAPTPLPEGSNARNMLIDTLPAHRSRREFPVRSHRGSTQRPLRQRCADSTWAAAQSSEPLDDTACGTNTAAPADIAPARNQGPADEALHGRNPRDSLPTDPVPRSLALVGSTPRIAMPAAHASTPSVSSNPGLAWLSPIPVETAQVALSSTSAIEAASLHTEGMLERPSLTRCGPESGFRYMFSREVGAAKPPSRALVGWAEGIVLRELNSGTYLELDRGAPLVRSTISIAFSCDGKRFASTHGDHTVKVFQYPEGTQVCFLDGHPRTPWTIRFHPKDPNILATGCLGSEVRIWDLSESRCIRRHTFLASISCVSFSPDGLLLAVTSGRTLLLWEWTLANPDLDRVTALEDVARVNRANAAQDGTSSSDVGVSNSSSSASDGLPRELLHDEHPYHMVDFHPSGVMLMTGVKNKYGTHPDAAPGSEEQFALRVVVHNFNRRVGVNFEKPVLEIPRVVAYNDAGIHFSPCGTMLAACVPGKDPGTSFRIAVMSLVARGPGVRIGSVLYESVLDPGRTIALTNLKFSPSSRHLLAGYSFRRSNPVLRDEIKRYEIVVDSLNSERSVKHAKRPMPPRVNVVDIYELTDHDTLEIRRRLHADVETSEVNHGAAEDEINVAVFAPSDSGGASGVVYGTQKGRVRLFEQYFGCTT